VGQCRATDDPVPCSQDLTSGYAGSCEAACAGAAGIAGTGGIEPGTMNAYDGDELATGKLGDLRATITLDHLVDAQGQTIAGR
jgi:hypothetical protein